MYYFVYLLQKCTKLERPKGAPWPEERDSHHCCLLPQLWRTAAAAGHYRDWIIMLSHGVWCLNVFQALAQQTKVMVAIFWGVRFENLVSKTMED